MPLYIAKSGDLDRCYRCLTHSLTHWQTLKDSATQLLTKNKSGALVTQQQVIALVLSRFTCKGRNIFKKDKPTPFSRFISLSLIVASSAVNSTIVAPSWLRTISLLLLHCRNIFVDFDSWDLKQKALLASQFIEKYICRLWYLEETK